MEDSSLSSRIGGYKSYFYAEFRDAKFVDFGIWEEGKIVARVDRAKGKRVGGYTSFESDVSTVEMYVAISSISVQQARTNLLRDTKQKTVTFDSAVKSLQGIWEKELSRVVIEGGSSDDKTKFYTAMYRTLMAPTNFAEGNVYLGFDDKEHSLDNNMQAFYSDISIWDVHRTECPWLGIFKPNVLNDIVKSMMRMYEQGGCLPKWPLANGMNTDLI